jgi:phosphoglycolate phosphatase-like HAD superfamily hydrolase
MTILFDLDYTLYDTVAMKVELVRALCALGPSEETVLETFGDGCRLTAKGVRYYVPELHAPLLYAASSDRTEAEYLAAIDAVPRSGARFLYPGVPELLTRLQAAGHRLILMTLGEDRYQRAKAVGAGLDAWFPEIRTTVEDKELIVGEYASMGAELAVVNDNVHETMRMRDVCPSAYYVIKAGPKGIPDDCDLPVVHDMDGVARLLRA